jgi:hypothetical protein
MIDHKDILSQNTLYFERKFFSFFLDKDLALNSHQTISNSPAFPTWFGQEQDRERVGLLIVDCQGRIASLNRKFINMWNLPVYPIASRDEWLVHTFVAKQFEDPKNFLKKVHEIYRHPNFVLYDTIKLKDGQIFGRYSYPLFEEKKIFGRIWKFFE